jgi:hypothetical protein
MFGGGIEGATVLRITLSALAAAAMATASPAAAQPATQPTIQQAFESAQSAYDAGRIVEARQQFEALLGRLKSSKSRSGALVKARLGAALVLDGEHEAALPLLTEALAGFTAPTEQDRGERAATLADRARANEALGLFGAAAADWQAAIDTGAVAPGSPGGAVLRAGVARSLIWADPSAARTLIDSLIATVPQTPDSKDQRALVHLLRGRVELNDGAPREALVHFRKAAQLAGGASTTRINLADMQVRGDLAIAYHLTGNVEEQQRLVAYSGAGSLLSEGLGRAAAVPLPACGDESGLAPGDVAVVEFAIGADGRVRSAVPVYAARADGRRDSADGGPATQFVQAVRGWFWRPADVAKLEPFWRQAVRVELRCSNSRSSQDLVHASFVPAQAEALAAIGVRSVALPEGTDAAALPQLKAELQRRIGAHGPQSPELVVPLQVLSYNGAAEPAERIGWLEQRLAILEKAGLAPDLLALERAQLAQMRPMGNKPSPKAVRDELIPLLAAEEAARPMARSTNYLRLQLAETQDKMGARAQATQLLQAIVATPTEALGRADPIRTSALLRLSNIAAARKDMSAAAEALAATGLSPEQCALVDVRPLPENKSVSSGAFPEQARRWNTGGLTRVEYDILPDGRTDNVRTVLSSPPFVFGKATEESARRFRFQPVFRPGNPAGCLAAQDNFRFKTM